jgi:hypothetical protein
LEWQKRNFTIAALSLLVGFENLFRKIWTKMKLSWKI